MLFAVFGAVWVAAFVYWIVAIVEVAGIPEPQFRAAGSEKVTWVLVVVLTQIIGALIWRFGKRAEVLAAAGRIPSPAARLVPRARWRGAAVVGRCALDRRPPRLCLPRRPPRCTARRRGPVLGARS